MGVIKLNFKLSKIGATGDASLQQDEFCVLKIMVSGVSDFIFVSKLLALFHSIFSLSLYHCSLSVYHPHFNDLLNSVENFCSTQKKMERTHLGKKRCKLRLIALLVFFLLIFLKCIYLRVAIFSGSSCSFVIS